MFNGTVQDIKVVDALAGFLAELTNLVKDARAFFAVQAASDRERRRDNNGYSPAAAQPGRPPTSSTAVVTPAPDRVRGEPS